MARDPRILIVEDDAAIRRLLRAALSRAGYDVIEAGNAREALAAADIDRPDAVLLDLGLPDRDGLELIQLLRAKGNAVLLVVSARIDTAEKVTALDLGADDYLTKPFDTEEVLARIRTALRHRRNEAAEAECVEIGAIVIDLARRRVLRDGEAVHLTPKEYDVLAALARHPDRVIGHVQLLRSIWGPAQERNVEYLRIAVRALRQKLEADPSRPRLIINEPGVGYRLLAGG
ncbi:response regulator transcription factor [Sphingomonas sp.]|uniref:response regulator n=1 Tax=Sphingomonas sp. TaxID=28214 RepID=UPI000DB07D6D|nr:response regulator transcription factor [Sphingomonas sp.]PZU06898.1 MAG: DNA-binding response regulator [Sphingomonas sp.]